MTSDTTREAFEAAYSTGGSIIDAHSLAIRADGEYEQALARLCFKYFNKGYQASSTRNDAPEQQTSREDELPTEAMCDRARWFILARDANIHTWGGLTRCIDKTIPYIEDKMKNDPLGHITKWDFADCVYRLMTTQTQDESNAANRRG